MHSRLFLLGCHSRVLKSLRNHPGRHSGFFPVGRLADRTRRQAALVAMPHKGPGETLNHNHSATHQWLATKAQNARKGGRYCFCDFCVGLSCMPAEL